MAWLALVPPPPPLPRQLSSTGRGGCHLSPRSPLGCWVTSFPRRRPSWGAELGCTKPVSLAFLEGGRAWSPVTAQCRVGMEGRRGDPARGRLWLCALCLPRPDLRFRSLYVERLLSHRNLCSCEPAMLGAPCHSRVPPPLVPKGLLVAAWLSGTRGTLGHPPPPIQAGC